MRRLALVPLAVLALVAGRAQAPAGAPLQRFTEFLEVFNSGDRARFQRFQQTVYPTMNVDVQMGAWARSGGMQLLGLQSSTPVRLTGFVLERFTSQFGLFAIEVEPEEPHRVTRLAVLQVPRPAEYSIPRVTEAGLISGLRAKLEHEAANDIFSGTVLLAKDGQVLFSGAYGMSDRENKIANTLDSRFRLGSMNKMFTAAAILQLVEAGRISLEDPVGKYVTDYPNQEVAAKVTIHHLLTHTGGTGDIFGPELTAHRLEVRKHDDYIALYGKRAPAFEPGSRWAYSNYGMVLLGVVIERVSGQSYYGYIDEHIYRSAGMTLSGSPLESEEVPGRVVGYLRGPHGWTPNKDTLGVRGSAAGGGLSTAGDLLKFSQALLGNKLLSPAYTQLLITGKVRAGGGMYAYGFEDNRRNGAGAVGHSGGAPGMSGDLRIYPHSGYVFAVLSNLDPPAAPQVTNYVALRLPQ